ncbi:hypothetical protein SAMN06298216_0372 [Spirosomataceae bacterium TFI 002]|nr:hypothetical protein SAMN06298216_0372 [Spirosomataceae bacterium TFI 002]
MIHRPLLSLLLVVFLSKGLFGQNTAASTNPPSIKWQSLETEKVKVLFPKGLENEANRIASLTRYIDENNKASIGDKNYKITVLLHGKSMYPNAFVTTSPFRSEFFGTPLQDWSIIGPNEWLDLLAVHEYRHALQFSNADRGVTKIFHILSGQLGWNVASNLSIPDWFWEGDATLSETLQTPSGRGRLPSFSEEQRALFEADRMYRYQTIRNGSFVKRLPSHYPLGYTMNLYAREHFGNDIWKNIIKDAGAYRRLYYPFNGALKRHIGMNSKKLYKASFKDLKSDYDSLLSKTELISFENISQPTKKLVTYYAFPHIESKGSYLALKSSRKETEKVVRLTNKGSEETLFSMGITNNSILSYGENKIVWLENQTNPRWENEDFSIVMSYDIKSGKKEKIRSKTKAIFAAVTHNDLKLLTVELTENQEYKLLIGDFYDSTEAKELSNSQNWAIAYPTFDTKGDLYYLAKKNGQIAIVRHDLKSDKQVLISPWMTQSLSELAIGKSHVYVRAGFSGIDNIYALPKTGGEFKKITSVKVGAMMPAVNEEEDLLLFANSTNTGQFISKQEITTHTANSVEIQDLNEMRIYNAVNNLSENQNILNKAPETNLTVKDYKGYFSDLKIHSWGISNSESSLSSIGAVEVNIEVDDYLEVNKISPFYAYNFNENASSGGLNYSYGKFATILNLGYTFRERNVIGIKDRPLAFNENELRVGLSLPLSWITGNYFWGSKVAANVRSISFLDGNQKDGWKNPSSNLVDVAFSLSSLRQRAMQNLQSKFGIEMKGRTAQSFSGEKANLMNFQMALLLPSFARNHGITISGGIQKEAFENGYQINDTFNYPRGFRITDNDQVRKLAFDYKLPLIYPDFGFWGLTYLKRLRANLFYDFGQLYGGTRSFNTQSTGIELRLDQTSLNVIDLPVGIRLGYRVQDPFTTSNNPLPKTFVELIIGN